MRLSFLALVGGVGLLAACGSETDRPCSAGSPGCVGDGDADSDSDTDADGDGDGDGDLCGDTDLDGYDNAACPDGTGDDCDDTDADVHPGANEVCNLLDDDCEGGADEELLAAGTDVVLPSGGETQLIAFAAGGSGYGLLTLSSEEPLCEGARTLAFTELRADGTAAGTPISISTTPECIYYHTLAVAPLEAGWVLAWADAPPPLGDSPGRDGVIQVAVVSGAQVTEGPRDIGDREDRVDMTPVIAVGPPGVLVVWNHDNAELRYVLLNPEDLSGSPSASLGQGSQMGGRPSAVWTGSAFLIATQTELNHASVYVVDEDGMPVDPRIDLGFNYWDSPAIAWDGVEAAYTQFQNLQQELYFLDAGGAAGPAIPIVTVPNASVQRMAGAIRSFAMTALSDPTGNLDGALHFWNISPRGILANALEPDDSHSVAAADPWVAPAVDGWALAWIDDDRQVRVDFVGCVAD